ncbi:hypothetical protein Cgig2_017995 [Carnegiea gigantea]|uniref:Uncharacterized protein n=1 Tax=Carnegiea gigantea TaxID=171969 RepID=A0A9Q1GLU4_9CARY|nr:hypothetical protein Cgig2_017995 [Carnegiea gigantea]
MLMLAMTCRVKSSWPTFGMFWYEQSLFVLKNAKISKKGMITKTSIMLGLRETDDKLKEAMDDLRAIDVDILTLGQYLQKECGEAIGFRYVASGPLDGKTFRADKRAIGFPLIAWPDIGLRLKWVMENPTQLGPVLLILELAMCLSISLPTLCN